MIIKACIFDLGGTIIDKYSLTPLVSFRKAFLNKGIILDSDLIRKDMGLNKIDHIDQICSKPVVIKDWYKKYNRIINDEDKEDLYNQFLKIQKHETIENMKIIPETYNVIKKLRKRNIKIGSTTGFDKEQIERVKSILKSNGIELDSYVSSTCLDKPGRPFSYMIHENMNRLNISSPKNVIKLDDTKSGIREGINAGCWTIGVSRWSVYMNVNDYSEINNLSTDNLINKIENSKKTLQKSGPNMIINDLRELPKIIDDINDMSTSMPFKIREKDSIYPGGTNVQT